MALESSTVVSTDIGEDKQVFLTTPTACGAVGVIRGEYLVHEGAVIDCH